MVFPTHPTRKPTIAFIGGGNMASAIIGGLIKRGTAADHIGVVEPLAAQRDLLIDTFGLNAQAEPGAWLASASLVVWAVKPQTFKDAALAGREHTLNALHLSVAAGVRSGSMASWLGTERIVRAMPNTPALVGKGMTALVARPTVSPDDRALVQSVVATTGEYVWLEQEEQLDAVTALSGSGPAYVFYFMEAMVEAGIQMGLSRSQAHRLAVATFEGSSALARESSDAPDVLRARVTSKGGTTHAALTAMDNAQLKQHFMHAIEAARQRAIAMGDEFGAA